MIFISNSFIQFLKFSVFRIFRGIVFQFRCLQLTQWFPENLRDDPNSQEFIYIASLLLKHIQVKYCLEIIDTTKKVFLFYFCKCFLLFVAPCGGL